MRSFVGVPFRSVPPSLMFFARWHTPLPARRHGLALMLLILVAAGAARAQAQHAQSLGGILSNLLKEPFYGEITGLTKGEATYKIDYGAQGGGAMVASRHEVKSASPLEMKFISSLQQGRRYAFPQCILDALGYNDVIQLLRAGPELYAMRAQSMPGLRKLTSLGGSLPFRARVIDIEAGSELYSVIVQAADTRFIHFSGGYETEDLRRVVQYLKRGETYEFPAVLKDALLTEEQRQQKAKPQDTDVEVLGRYIGEWQGTLEDAPKARILMRCHWNADGTGIWRELTFERNPGVEPAMPAIAVITYDADLRCYLDTSYALGSPPPLKMAWDSAAKSFTSTLPPNGDRLRVTTATFASHDRISWQTVTRSSTGEHISTIEGSYKRVSDTAQVAALPPELEREKRAFQAIHLPSGYAETVTGLLNLRSLPPFRGKITALSIDEKEINAIIDCVDGRHYSVLQGKDQDWDKALAAAKRLTIDQTFEFPDVLADDYVEPAADAPPSQAMSALEMFIGEWRSQVDSSLASSKASSTYRHFWKRDGQGMWREDFVPASTFEQGGRQVRVAARIVLSLITHDPSTGNYIETRSMPEQQPQQSHLAWDPNSKVSTQTIALPSPNGGTGGQRQIIRRFVSRDRIEWVSTGTQPDGKPLAEVKGHTERIK